MHASKGVHPGLAIWDRSQGNTVDHSTDRNCQNDDYAPFRPVAQPRDFPEAHMVYMWIFSQQSKDTRLPPPLRKGLSPLPPGPVEKSLDCQPATVPRRSWRSRLRDTPTSGSTYRLYATLNAEGQSQNTMNRPFDAKKRRAIAMFSI